MHCRLFRRAIVACNLKIGSSQIASFRTKRIPRFFFHYSFTGIEHSPTLYYIMCAYYKHSRKHRTACAWVCNVFGCSVGGEILPEDLLYNNIIITIITINSYIRVSISQRYYIFRLARVAFIIIIIII